MQPLQCLFAMGIVSKNRFWSVVLKLMSVAFVRGCIRVVGITEVDMFCTTFSDQQHFQGRTKFFTGWNGCSRDEIKKGFAIRCDAGFA